MVMKRRDFLKALFISVASSALIKKLSVDSQLILHHTVLIDPPKNFYQETDRWEWISNEKLANLKQEEIDQWDDFKQYGSTSKTIDPHRLERYWLCNPHDPRWKTEWSNKQQPNIFLIYSYPKKLV